MNSYENNTQLLVKTRRHRKQALEVILQQIIAIRNAEADYMDRVPDNLCGTENYEVAEDAVSVLDEIITMMEEVYP